MQLSLLKELNLIENYSAPQINKLIDLHSTITNILNTSTYPSIKLRFLEDEKEDSFMFNYVHKKSSKQQICISFTFNKLLFYKSLAWTPFNCEFLLNLIW